jgi:hypothetical protein
MKKHLITATSLSVLGFVGLFLHTLYKMGEHLYSLGEYGTQDYVGLVVLYGCIIKFLVAVLDKNYERKGIR